MQATTFGPITEQKCKEKLKMFLIDVNHVVLTKRAFNTFYKKCKRKTLVKHILVDTCQTTIRQYLTAKKMRKKKLSEYWDKQVNTYLDLSFCQPQIL